MKRYLIWALLCFVHLASFFGLGQGLWVLEWPPLNCTQEGLPCEVNKNNCLDEDWLMKNNHAPTPPEDLTVKVDIRRKENGDLVPVIMAEWKAIDMGIQEMKGTEVHILAYSTNQNLCLQYKFPKGIPSMRNLFDEMWSFSSDQVVVEPGQMYKVTVYNLPKPNIGHTSYDKSKTITVPDCSDPVVGQCTYCQQTGGSWQPNITMEHVSATSMLNVRFNIEQLSAKYAVDVSCAGKNKRHEGQSKTLCYDIRGNEGASDGPSLWNNETSLNLTFDLDEWTRTCCDFKVQVTPYFPLCKNDCVRRGKSFNICPVSTPETPAFSKIYAIVGITTGALLAFIVFCCVTCALRKHKKVPPTDPLLPKVDVPQHPSFPKEPPKVLIIYSKDHRLYNDIVLKLCAFLRAKCGTEVVVDLLDTTGLGTVGRMRWLEWQRRQLKNPSDKILVLCSPGVQAKWKAMCGLDQVLLREDVLSPNDDILIPFLNLFLPDMQQAASLGKYMVAYFDDVSSEQDVPSVLHIAVRYKLMKHFEELYFRILDIEKYQPEQISHIEGIGPEEYFKCPSGKALREAIETFQAYQLEHHDWFREECVNEEEEVIVEHSPILDSLVKQALPVYETVPVYNAGDPVYCREIEINETSQSVHVVTPELNPESEVASVMELRPELNVEIHPLQRLSPVVKASPGVTWANLRPQNVGEEESCYMAGPLSYKAAAPTTENRLHLEGDSETARSPVEIEEEEPDSLLSPSPPSPRTLHRLRALQDSLSSSTVTPSIAVEDEGQTLPSEVVTCSLSLAMDEEEAGDEEEVPCSERPSSGSDQGYNSTMPSHNELPARDREDSLMALIELQQELFLDSQSYSNST